MDRNALKKLTVKALRELARELGVPGRTRMTKPQLVEAISAHQERAASQPDIPPPAPSPSLQEVQAHGEAPSSGSSRPRADVTLTDVGQLPERYGHSRVVLLLQKPGFLYTYWELRDDHLDDARAQLGEWGSLILRVKDQHGPDWYDITVHSPVGDWFFRTDWLGRTVFLDLGLRAADGRFVTLATSNRVEIPTGKASDRVDPEWMVRDEEFARMYALSGGLNPGSGSGDIQRLLREGWLPSSGSNPS